MTMIKDEMSKSDTDEERDNESYRLALGMYKPG